MSSDSCSLRIGRFGTFPAASAAWRVMRRMAPAYGRSASMRCSARRRRAAATISIARVIFWMFLTDAMRLLTSLSAMAPRYDPAATAAGSSLLRPSPERSASSSDSGWPSSSRS